MNTDHLSRIERLCQDFSSAHAEMRMLVLAIQEELQQVKRRYLARLRASVGKTRERHANLRLAVESAPELFEKPKTRILHGIKIGFRKQKGGITWADADKVVRALHQQFGGQADAFLHIKQVPDKTALNKLDASTLRRLGVEIHADHDEVVVEPVDGDVDRVVNALIEDAVEEEERP